MKVIGITGGVGCGKSMVMDFLARYDLPVHLAVQAHRIYGAQALQKLREALGALSQ